MRFRRSLEALTRASNGGKRLIESLPSFLGMGCRLSMLHWAEIVYRNTRIVMEKVTHLRYVKCLGLIIAVIDGIARL